MERISWTKAARKHNISRTRTLYVMNHPAYTDTIPAPADSRQQDPRLLFLGPDENGVELEVMAVRTTKGLVVIHAMKLKPNKYPDYHPTGD
jgi:hypothetical protein